MTRTMTVVMVMNLHLLFLLQGGLVDHDNDDDNKSDNDDDHDDDNDDNDDDGDDDDDEDGDGDDAKRVLHKQPPNQRLV